MDTIRTTTEDVFYENWTNATNATKAGGADFRLPIDMVLPIRLCIGLIMAVGLLGNGLIIASVSLVRKLRTPFYIGLASLAICDVLSLIFLPVIPIVETYRSDHRVIGEWFCYILVVLDRGLPVTSILHTLVVTIERYMAICWPFKYTFLKSKTKITVFMVFVWLLGIGLALGMIPMTRYIIWPKSQWCVIMWDAAVWHVYYDTAFINGIFFVVLVVVAILSGMMVAKISQKNMTGENVSAAAAKNRMQAVVIIIAITIMFAICILPWQILFMVEEFGHKVTRTLTTRAFLTLMWVGRLGGYINSAANPLIYSIASANFRQHLVCFAKKRKQLK